METVVMERITRQCPFSNQIITCSEANCGDCEIRQGWERTRLERIASRMEDYWRHQNSGAEGGW